MLFGLVIIALCFLAKPWIGIVIAIIIIINYSNKKKAKVKAKDLWPKICPRPGTTPDEMLMYKGCIVEIFKNLNITRITKPDGKDLGASFRNVADAVTNIEEHIQ